MNIFEWYMLFAVTTALVAVYELLHPVMKKRIADIEPDNVENLPLHYITFFLVSVLIAPMVFLSCIIPEWGMIFREKLYTGLFTEE